MIIGHPGSWQQFQFRPDNKGLNVMEMKSKYLHEQYLFEAQMLNLQQLHQQNMFMNGSGGGGPLPSSEPTPTYSTALQLTFNDTLANVSTAYSYDVTSAAAWNNSGRITFNGSNSNFEAVETVNNNSIILKGNEEGLAVILDTFSGDAYLTSIIDINDNCITEIGDNSFDGASALETVTLNAVTTIGIASFANCSSLTLVSFSSLITIPNGLDVTQGTFAYCDLSSLANLDDGFPSLVTAGGFSFYQTGLNSVRSLTLNSIGVQAFARSSVGTVDITTGGTITIRDRAFNNCSSLNNISIPSKIDWTSVTTQFLGVADEGNGVFNASDISEGSVTYLETPPKVWVITPAS